MTLFSITSLLVLSFCLIQAIFIFYKANNSVQRMWGIFNISVALWAAGLLWVSMLKSPSPAFWAWKVTYLAGLCVIVSFYHLVYRFCNLNKRKRLLAVNILAIILAFTVVSKYFIYNIKILFNNILYNVATSAYTFFIAMIIIVVLMSFFEILKFSKATSGIKKIQAMYFIYGFGVGWAGGISTFLPSWGILIYPTWHFPICLYILLMTYAIFKYQIIDIKIVVTRSGIFTVVYLFVLGVPFWLGYKYNLWQYSTWIMLFLATSGPFIYLYLQNKIENRILREQKQYQEALKQAARGLIQIRDLIKLLDLIVHIITRTVKVSYAAIYLYDEDKNEYTLRVSRDKGRIPIDKINPDNSLILLLAKKHEPIIYEEIKLHNQGERRNETFEELETELRLLTAIAAIPIFLENKLIGILVLGEKISNQVYTLDDLNVFQVLMSQAALAIENAKFYEETKMMQEQLAHAEKMATIGTMADGLSHQINNRFYALSLISGDILDTIKMTHNPDTASPETKQLFDQIIHALERIQANVVQGGDVVRGLLKYTRKGEEAFEPLDLDSILNNALEMIQYKIRISEIDIIRNYPKDIPKIKGNLIQLQEVFFNFFDNAYDAITEKKATLKEEGYRGKVEITASRANERTIAITIQDNGMGVKDTDTKKVFTPFFTTKASAHKGTGLGLYVINRIITDIHHGKIAFDSEYKVGTRFFIELPAA